MIKQIVCSLLIALFLATAVFAAGGEDTEFSPAGSLVVDLTEKTFDDELTKKEFALVEFYAPWCPHCKKIVPEYEKLAKDIDADADLKDKVLIAKVDCDANQGVPGKFNVQGFPSIKLFRNGQAYKDYEGPRTTEAMKTFLAKKTGPVAVALEDVAAIKDFVSKKRGDTATQTIVVGQFKSADSEARKAFIKAAELPAFDNFIFAEVSNSDKEQFTVYPYFDDSAIESTDFEDAQAFIKKKGYPVIDELNGETFGRFAEANLPIVIAFTKFSNADEKKQIIDLVSSVAKNADVEGKASFTYSDGEVYGEQYKIMGGNPEQLPGIAIMNLEKRTNFPYTGELKAESVAQWVSDVLTGKVGAHVRSQPVPETQEEEEVYTLVGKSFDEIVLDDSKDVFVEFYAPWCGHCKSLSPKYEEVAKAFNAVAKDKLVIAKLDATENDTPNSGVEVQGFPTLYFYPAGSKAKPIVYEGARTVEDLITFIKTNAVAAKDLIQNVSAPAASEATEEKPKHDEL